MGRGGVEADGDSYAVGISANGRYVLFSSAASNLVPNDTTVWDVFMWDRRKRAVRRVSLGHDGAPATDIGPEAVMSDDGRFVAFASWSPNVVPHDSNGAADVFVRDRQRHVTRRVSLGRRGAEGNGPSWVVGGISADGGSVVFIS